MKLFTKRILRNFALFLLLSSGVVMVYMLFKLNETEKTIAKSLTVKPVQNTETEMKRFFMPVNNELIAAGIRGKKGFYHDLDVRSINKFYIPILQKFDQLSSMGIGRSDGFEHDIIPTDGDYHNRLVHFEKNSEEETWLGYRFKNGKLVQFDQWKSELQHDPRVRPWFKGALNNINQNKVHWTEPYVYNTNQKLGITASVAWSADEFDSLNYVLAYDLTLEDISKFTESLKATENSMTFVLTEDQKFIGLPDHKKLQSEDEKNEAFLQEPMESVVPEIGIALDKWKEMKHIDEPFYVECFDQEWWFYFKRFQLSKERSIIIGVAIPESDLLAQINQTKYTVMGGFSIVFLLSLVVFISLRQTQKVNRTLLKKNQEIQEKNLIIQEKNKDIFDSLNYAKGLQNAILPREQDMDKYLKDYFVLFQPKEVISGDFYWLNRLVDDETEFIYYAAADCTGHGVPGAMVSVVCANALNRCVKEYKITDPGKLLDKAREIIIQTFEKSEKKLRDGMDISLCVLKKDSSDALPTLLWAGANNPVWIVRNTVKDLRKEFPYRIMKSKHDNHIQLIELKADKQSVGDSYQSKPFNTKVFQLKKGDQLYTFSDGYADQFGNKNHDNPERITGKKFKTKNMKKLILSFSKQPMNDQKIILNQTLDQWKGDLEQIDDVCIIGIRI